jgi:hypothetical protein
MIETLYKRYFQKSRSFLYPALGIPRRPIYPLQTFVALQGKIRPEDRKLICLFQHDQTPAFEEFEARHLYSSPLFIDSDVRPGEPSLYVFDYMLHDEDWDLFLVGKYSRFSEPFKNAVRQHYGEKSAEYKYMDTFLYPKKYFGLYSELLKMSKEVVATTGELCNPYDPQKEKLVISTNILEKSPDLY